MINLKNIPEQAGVYIFKDKKGYVIYVGKAINLKSRVSSYFTNKLLLQPKTLKLVANIASIFYILVESEIEALILESDLIKKYKPKYNIALKDDKSFKYIVIQKDRVFVSRDGEKYNGQAKIFGPFPYGDSVNLIIKSLRKVFPFRDCSDSKFLRYKKLNRPCLYGYTKICPAPCVKISGVDINKINLAKFKRFMTGNKNKLIKELKKDMVRASKDEKYEEALKLRNQIKKLENLNYSARNSFEYIKNPNLLIDRANEEIDALKKLLKKMYPTLKSLNRVEFYDISNISGKFASGSMVVSEMGLIKKSQYRRFRIKTKNTSDDAAMLFEVLSRRQRHKDWSKPDLIVLDGGKPQLSVVSKLPSDFNVPVIALAKKHEIIVLFNEKENKFNEIWVSKTNKGLQFMQRLRDEAHRFAILYHHKLRASLL